MSNPLADVLPPRSRAVLYAIVWTAGLVLAALQAAAVALIATGTLDRQPVALTVALAVYGVLSAPTAALAHANLTPDPERRARPG